MKQKVILGNSKHGIGTVMLQMTSKRLSQWVQNSLFSGTNIDAFYRSCPWNEYKSTNYLFILTFH